MTGRSALVRRTTQPGASSAKFRDGRTGPAESRTFTRNRPHRATLLSRGINPARLRGRRRRASGGGWSRPCLTLPKASTANAVHVGAPWIARRRARHLRERLAPGGHGAVSVCGGNSFASITTPSTAAAGRRRDDSPLPGSCAVNDYEESAPSNVATTVKPRSGVDCYD
jgi:hypothetical protein